jgi:rhodanese-related sulfurtransferase
MIQKQVSMNKKITEGLEIPIEEARTLLQDNNKGVLIDIRSNREICLGYIKGARFVPPGLVDNEINHLSGDKDRPILIYCTNGTRSLPIVSRLQEAGFKHARSIIGGYNAWLNEDYDIVTDSKLTVHQLNRYSRNMLLENIGEEGQLKLLNAKVLLVGAGVLPLRRSSILPPPVSALSALSITTESTFRTSTGRLSMEQTMWADPR